MTDHIRRRPPVCVLLVLLALRVLSLRRRPHSIPQNGSARSGNGSRN